MDTCQNNSDARNRIIGQKIFTTLTGQTKTQWWKITDDLRKNSQADKDLVA